MMKRKDNLGQTLLEAIVAIGILSTGIVSALSLARASLAAESSGLASVVAGNLAREGVEVTRMIRDSNWLAGRTWDDGLHSANDYTAVPVYDSMTGEWELDFSVNGMTTAKVFRQTREASGIGAGFYFNSVAVPSNAENTGFRRLVKLDPICRAADGSMSVITSGSCPTAKAGVRVTVDVEWDAHGGVRSLSAEERMYDWR